MYRISVVHLKNMAFCKGGGGDEKWKLYGGEKDFRWDTGSGEISRKSTLTVTR